MTGSMAERSRHIDADEPISLDAESYLANLADMIVAVLDAEHGEVCSRAPNDAISRTGRPPAQMAPWTIASDRVAPSW